MRNLSVNNPEKAKFILLFTAGVLFSSVIIVLITYKISSKQATPIHSRKNATISMDKIEHTETKEGVKQWSLKAETADYFKKENTAYFTTIIVKLYSENNKTTTITANNGILDTVSGNITLSGNVMGTNSSYKIAGEKIYYNKNMHSFSSDVRTKIYDKFSSITGDGFEFLINSEKLSMHGNVSVVYSSESISENQNTN